MQDKRKNNSTECQSISKASNYRIDRNKTERLKPHCSLHTRKQNCWFRRSVCLWLFTCFSVKKKNRRYVSVDVMTTGHILTSGGFEKVKNVKAFCLGKSFYISFRSRSFPSFSVHPSGGTTSGDDAFRGPQGNSGLI